MRNKVGLITLLVGTSWIWALASTSAQAMTGSGTDDDPYIIQTEADLNAIRNDLSAWYELVNDISMVQHQTDEGFEPVGGENNPFQGHFNGKGHKIKSLFVNRPNTSDIGLFGRVSAGATISNIRLVNVKIIGYDCVGGLVGSSCGTITNCATEGDVSGRSRIGGLVGGTTRYPFGSIKHSYSTATVDGIYNVGGLIGWNEGIISNCYSAGNITGDYQVGGLIGTDDYSELIECCYSVGKVTGSPGHIGGLIGVCNGIHDYRNSFWDIETSGTTLSAGGIGKTTAEMKQKDTFSNTGWDFEAMWDIIEGDTYPFLKQSGWYGTCYVPDDYLTIREAVMAANPGNTIIVRDGIYTENVVINKKLTLISEYGAESAFVQATNANGNVFEVTTDYVTISGFTITTGGDQGAPIYLKGIYLGEPHEVKHCNISNNIINNSTWGIRMTLSRENAITNNNISATGTGIEVVGGSANIFKDNTIISCGIGILTRRWSDGYGTHIDNRRNRIIGNIIDDIDTCGLSLQYSTETYVMKNKIDPIALSSIFLLASSNNTIYLNNFIKKGDYPNAISDPGNAWYSQETLTYIYNGSTYTSYLGNYWSDYTGPDVNGDGIGDIPYVFEGGQDNYPLIVPFKNYSAELNNLPFSPTNLTQFKSDGQTTMEVGGTTNESTVVFKANVSDPDEDGVKLQIELREVSGPNQEFQNEFTQKSNFVISGGEASTAAFGLVDADYHWQARTVDEKGSASQWVEFGGNNISEADFIVQRAHIVLVDTLKISPRKDVYYIGDRIDAEFTIENKGEGPITLGVLTVGGRFNGNRLPNGEYPDFTWKNNICLTSGDTYLYRGSLTLNEAGNYHFFCAYQKPNGTWSTGIDLGPGLTDEDRVKDADVLWPEGPYISNINPGAGAPGVTVIIDGVNFDQIWPLRYVTFGWQTAHTVDWQDRKIIVTAPDGSGTVEVTAGPPSSNPVPFTYKELFIDSIYPTSGKPNAEVIIEGRNFGVSENRPSFRVKFGLSLATIKSWSDTRIVVGAPSDFGTGIKDAKMMSDLITYAYFGWKKLVDEAIKKAIEDVITYLCAHGVRIPMGNGVIEVDVVVRNPAGESNTKVFTYDVNEIDLSDLLSPGELRAYDSQGRVAGLVNAEIKNEIPYSYCDGNSILIVYPSDVYLYEVHGTEVGTYGLNIISANEDGKITFGAANIPTRPNTVHQYNTDWQALLQNQQGVTLDIDKDGDGNFERTVTSHSELTSYDVAIEPSGYELVEQNRISRTKFEYTFRLCAANSGIWGIKDVVMQLTQAPENAVVIDDTVGFSQIEAGQDISSNDTFKIQIDRSIGGLEDQIVWRVRTCTGPKKSDFNYDWDVDFTDLKQFVDAWLNKGYGMPEDLYPDRIINFKDFGRFAKDWAGGK